MGKKKGSNNAASKKIAEKAAKYSELTEINDRILAASATTPAVKDLQSSCESIWHLTEQVRVIQEEPHPPEEQQLSADRRERNFSKFINWCSENGVQGDKIELAVYDGLGVGVRATQKIQHHEMFLSVPRRAMMTVEYDSSPISQLLKTDPIASRMPNIALSLYLLSEKYNRTSRWKPYIDVLPADYDTSLYFTPKELLLLKGSASYEQAVGMQRNIARQYAYFWAIFNNQHDKYPVLAKNFTYDMYRWAVSTVMTRQNVLPATHASQTMGVTLALIPYWDMCNHLQGEMLTDYDEDLAECHCYSHSVCQPGDQVYICYGTRPNCDFLIHNGFVCSNNPHDVVQIKLGLGKSDQFIKTRRSLLEKYKISSTDVQVFHFTLKDSKVPDNLMTFLRIFNATEDELEMLVNRESNTQSTDEFEPISEECDRKCLNYLRDRCKLLMRTYTQDFTESDGMSETHLAMIKKLINSEKNILEHVIALTDDTSNNKSDSL